MSLAVITGHCYQNDWAQIGNSAPIPESATLLLGVRDLDPCEEEGLARSSIQMVRWHEGKPQSSVQAASTTSRCACQRFISILIWILRPEGCPRRYIRSRARRNCIERHRRRHPCGVCAFPGKSLHVGCFQSRPRPRR
jgi:hypothetical protein